MKGTCGGTPEAAFLRHLTRGKSGPAIKHGNVGRASTHAETTLIVGEGVRVKGTLDGCDTLIVKGLVETSFKARSLQVLEGGGFVGTVEAENAEIAGTFDGVLAVQGCLKVRSTGHLTGTIHYARMSIEEGGEISGDVQVGGCLPPPLQWQKSKPRSSESIKPVESAEPPNPRVWLSAASKPSDGPSCKDRSGVKKGFPLRACQKRRVKPDPVGST